MTGPDAPGAWSGPPLGRLAVLGVGHMGGSFALAARAAGAVTDVVGFARGVETRAQAERLGIVGRCAPSAAEAVRDASLVLLATPTRSLGPLVQAIAPALAPGSVVFDVGSVKAPVIAAVEAALPAGVAFVPCHPIAGTERSGPESASRDLFRGARCLVCPSARATPEAVATVERLWAAVGAETRRMDAAEHDRVLAASSHLPHVAAYGLSGALAAGADLDAVAAMPTASLRDTSRIAASSPAMWRDIFLDNRVALLPLVDELLGFVTELRAALAAGDGPRAEALLERAQAARRRVVPA